MREAHQSAGLITQHHEKANWLSRNPDIRPFDTVYKLDHTDTVWKGQDCTIGDPSRIGGMLPYQKYMKRGTAGQKAIDSKGLDYRDNLYKYGPMTKPVSHTVVAFEIGGGFTESAVKWIDSIDEARRAKLKHTKVNTAAGSSTRRKQVREATSWTAMGWKARRIQKIGWEISKCQALGVLRGIRMSLKLAKGFLSVEALR